MPIDVATVQKRGLPYQLVQVPEGHQLTPKPEKASTHAESQHLFHSDRKGDSLNVRYGGLHKGDIPKYRRLGGGRIVGLNSGLRITKESAYRGRDLEVGPNLMARTPRYADPRSARHTSNSHIKRIVMISRPQPQHAPVLGEINLSVPEDPFLPSSSDPTRFVRFEREISTAEKIARLEHEEGTDYRSISGLVKPSDLEMEETEDDHDLFDGLGVTGGESQDEYFKRRNIEMDRALRDDPTDVKKWLEFVQFQDEVSLSNFVGSASKRALNKAERTSTCEIKLSILDRALAVKGNESSEDLLLAHLKAAAEVWDPKQVLIKWGETLRHHPTLTGLWIEYVSWRQTTWANFTIREVVDVFISCFKVLSTAAAKESLGSEQREMLEGNAIYLFLRLCLMLRQAGFSERAFAAFQATLELNLFRPNDLASPAPQETEAKWKERVFTEFEAFWEDESPRIGEPGALGWKNRHDDAEPPSSEASKVPPSSLVADANRFERWADEERRTSETQPRPARATDPGVDDDVDPFRVVLFDDVRDFMMIYSSPDSKVQIVYAFLTFLGLPFTPPDCPTSTPFTTDAFIHSELAETPSLRDRFWPHRQDLGVPFDTMMGEAMEPERRSALQHPADAPFHATPLSVDLLFGSKPKWFRTLQKQNLDHVDVDVVRNILSLLRPVVPDGFLTLDFFSFEAVQSIKVAVKLAKQVLRDARQNLAFWDGYARLERQRGKSEDSRNVYVTALSMYRTFDERDQIDAPLLWRAWAEMEWEEVRTNVALKILVASMARKDEEVELSSLANVKPEERPSAAQILRARQAFATSLEASFTGTPSQAALRNRNNLAFNSALFEYLSSDFSLTPCTNILEHHLFQLECAGMSRSAEQEEALIAYVKILFRHSEMGKGYRPGQMRDVVERAIEAFPHNTLFLSVFFFNELRTKIQNRVRTTFERLILTPATATSTGYLFAIFAELHLDARSYNVWAVRNLFDRAVDNPRTRSSASLWSMYIEFELRNNELKRAKALVYRAIRECPWCRDLYLTPFSSPSLRPLFSSRELRSLYNLLLEKGLRVRIELSAFDDGVESDLEEGGDEEAGMLEREGETRLEGGEEAGGGTTREVEVMFEERARLMPY